MKITPSLLRAWNACWSDEQIAAKLAGRTAVTPREVADDVSISAEDRLWVLTRLLAHLDESAARLYAIECAATVAHLAGDEDDQAQYLGLLNRLIEIEDLPEDQRAAARAAAWVASAAAWYAAWYAAWDAARSAAWYAARSAAWYAARAAARSAARDAARDAALESAIVRALEWLGPHADGREGA